MFILQSLSFCAFYFNEEYEEKAFHYLYQEKIQSITSKLCNYVIFKYSWNNFLHTQVEQCIHHVLNNPATEVDGTPEQPLLNQLFTDVKLPQRMLDEWDQNDTVQSVLFCLFCFPSLYLLLCFSFSLSHLHLSLSLLLSLSLSCAQTITTQSAVH